MSNYMYYGEIVAKLAACVHKCPKQLSRIHEVMKHDNEDGDTLHGLCADAGKVFDSIEDLSDEHFLDWNKALDIYSEEFCNFFSYGKKPTTIDMLSMTVVSVKTAMGLNRQ